MKGHFVITVTGQGTGALRVLPRKNCPPGIQEHLAEKLPPQPPAAGTGAPGWQERQCSVARDAAGTCQRGLRIVTAPRTREGHLCCSGRAERLPWGDDVGPVPGRMWSIHRHRMGRNPQQREAGMQKQRSVGGSFAGQGVLRAAEEENGGGGIAGRCGLAGHPFPSPALEIPQDVGDDVVLGSLIHFPGHRWQTGAVKYWRVFPRGPSRSPHPAGLQK